MKEIRQRGERVVVCRKKAKDGMKEQVLWGRSNGHPEGEGLSPKSRVLELKAPQGRSG